MDTHDSFKLKKQLPSTDCLSRGQFATPFLVYLSSSQCTTSLPHHCRNISK